MEHYVCVTVSVIALVELYAIWRVRKNYEGMVAQVRLLNLLLDNYRATPEEQAQRDEAIKSGKYDFSPNIYGNPYTGGR